MEVLEVESVEALEVLEVVEAPCPAPAEVRRMLVMAAHHHHGNMETGDTLAPVPGPGHNLSMSRH